jgi:hypothetical protein
VSSSVLLLSEQRLHRVTRQSKLVGNHSIIPFTIACPGVGVVRGEAVRGNKEELRRNKVRTNSSVRIFVLYRTALKLIMPCSSISAAALYFR